MSPSVGSYLDGVLVKIAGAADPTVIIHHFQTRFIKKDAPPLRHTLSPGEIPCLMRRTLAARMVYTSLRPPLLD